LTSVVLRQFIAASRHGSAVGPARDRDQRFNSALDLSPHFHPCSVTGVYSFSARGQGVFHPTPAPSDDDVARVAAAVFRRVGKIVDVSPRQQRRFVKSGPSWSPWPSLGSGGATGPRGAAACRVPGPTAEVDAFVMGRCAHKSRLQL